MSVILKSGNFATDCTALARSIRFLVSSLISTVVRQRFHCDASSPKSLIANKPDRIVIINHHAMEVQR